MTRSLVLMTLTLVTVGLLGTATTSKAVVSVDQSKVDAQIDARLHQLLLKTQHAQR